MEVTSRESDVNDDRIDKSDPRTLAELMGLADAADEAHGDWQPADLASIMAHQLRAALAFDLGHNSPERHQLVRELLQERRQEIVTFEDLFQHANPPIELLRLVKDFAKSRYQHPEGPLPPKIATMLYYLCIAAARLHLGERISELGDAELVTGLEWALRQSWIDQPSRQLIEQCLKKFAPN